MINVALNKNFVSNIIDFARLEHSLELLNSNVVFSLQLGCDDEKALFNTIEKVDFQILEKSLDKGLEYNRINSFDSFFTDEEKDKYSKMYEKFKIIKNTSQFMNENFLFQCNLPQAEVFYKRVMLKIIDEFQVQMNSELKVRNFTIILFKWINDYFEKIFSKNPNSNNIPKFVYTGKIKTNEFLFLKFIALCGCNVYAISLDKEVDIKIKTTEVFVINGTKDITTQFTEFDKGKLHKETVVKKETAVQEKTETKKTDRVIPKIKLSAEKTRKESVNGLENRNVEVSHNNGNNVINNAGEKVKMDLNYEEIAQLASSVVMISVYNEKNELFASGSGVIINSSGFILTNCHVVSGGHSFTIRHEDSEEEIEVEKLVKYNQNLDLALLKVSSIAQTPLDIFRGEKLVRGQKVVAIGSPLGLFNTVSEGIIAGFREIRAISMIQFTAPISSGSSGGALVNLKGELIGIVTANFVEGQNLNLAVDNKTIIEFLRGFI